MRRAAGKLFSMMRGEWSCLTFMGERMNGYVAGFCADAG
jgi:hypothetical protein